MFDLSTILRTILVATFTPPLIALFAIILHKFGVKELTAEEISAAKSKTYPRLYQSIYYGFTFLYLAICIGLLFLLIFILPKVVHLIVGNEALFIINGNGVLIFALLNFFGSLFLVGSFLGIFFWKFSSSSFKQFLIVAQAKGRFENKLDIISGIKAIEKIGLVYYLLIIPLLYFSLHNYQAVYPNKIVYNNFFDLSDKVYTLNQVSTFSATTSVTHTNRSTHLNLDGSFMLRDGRVLKFTSWPSYMSDQFYPTLDSNGIKINLLPPDQTTINTVYSCYDKNTQDQFKAIFQLKNTTFTIIQCK